MRLFTSYLVVLATAIAAFASVAQAGSSSPAIRALELRGQGMDALTVSRPISPAVRAQQIRGQGMTALCDNPTLPREGYVAVCGTEGASSQPTRAELRALQIRGEAMDAVTAVPVTVASSTGFNWSDFSIGAASMFGLVLLAGGIAAAARFGRKGSVRPSEAS